jgi:hypothetical protein
MNLYRRNDVQRSAGIVLLLALFSLWAFGKGEPDRRETVPRGSHRKLRRRLKTWPMSQICRR